MGHSSYVWWSLDKGDHHVRFKIARPGTITLSQQDYLPILVDSFLIDRRSQGLSPETIELYTKKPQYFLKYCERLALTQASQINPDFIRRYLLELSERHNPDGAHEIHMAQPQRYIDKVTKFVDRLREANKLS